MADPNAPQGYPPATVPGYPPQQGYPPAPQEAYPPAPQEAYPPPQPQPYPPQQQPVPPQYQQQPAYPQAPYQGQPPPTQQQTHQQVVVVTTQPTVVQNVTFRRTPVIVTDSNGQQVQTVLQYRSGCMTWLVCCLICWLTFECGLCCLGLIAFCINDLKDVYHVTPTDGKVVGSYKRL